MTSRPLVVGVACGVHGVALRLHPRPFREEFGEELADAFERRALEAHAERGAVGVVLLLARCVADTLHVTVGERAALGMERGGPRGLDRDHGGRGGEVMSTLMQDLVVGVRMLARRPVFALAAIGTLALGIGANTAIFSVVNGVLLRSLPFPESEQLVRLYHSSTEDPTDRGSVSLIDRQDWAERTTSLSDVAVYSTLPSGLLLTGGDEPVEVRTAYVSAGFFGALGREAYLGRTLRDDEEYADNRVVVLSHGFWQRRFGGDESIVGRDITLADTGFRVVGVMPPDFRFPTPDIEAWVFITIIPQASIPTQIRGVRFMEALGRIRSGTSLEQASAEMSAVAAALTEEYPDQNEGLDAAALVPLRESITGAVGPTLLVILAAVGLVLLIACANVANLLLSRAAERQREIDIRRALGAGRRRLVRQLLTESGLLALVGGTAGAALAYWGVGAIREGSADLLPRAAEVGIDMPVLLFSLGLTVLAALVSGLAPALKITAGARGDGLHTSTRGAARRPGASRSWAVLVGSQVGLAMLVVIASGLLLRSLWALQAVEVGVESDRLVGLSLTISDARYPERPDYMGAYQRIMERLEGMPGVASVASIRYLPLRRGGESFAFAIDGKPETVDDPARASMLQVSPGFFATAGVPVLAGREFTDEDRVDAPPVMVINDALRRRYWPGETPVGEFVDIRGFTRIQIVGVVGDIRQEGLGEDSAPTVYLAQDQLPRRGMAFVIRTEGDPELLLGEVQAAVHGVDPDQPIENLATMGQIVTESTAQPRFFSLLLAGFALLSLLLASLGIYGVVSHSVSRRVSEIGIRVALGAPRAGVLRMVIRSGMRPVLAGAVGGLAAALVAMRFMAGILYEVSAFDPTTFVAVPLLLVAAGLLACWLPAARALRIDPTEALRSE